MKGLSTHHIPEMLQRLKLSQDIVCQSDHIVITSLMAHRAGVAGRWISVACLPLALKTLRLSEASFLSLSSSWLDEVFFLILIAIGENCLLCAPLVTF